MELYFVCLNFPNLIRETSNFIGDNHIHQVWIQPKYAKISLPKSSLHKNLAAQKYLPLQ